MTEKSPQDYQAPMSYLLPHLRSGWAVDQAILSEEDRLVVVRFGHDYCPVCQRMDETLYGIQDDVSNFAVIYLVDTSEVSDFNVLYELYDRVSVMFFYRNKHMMIDLGKRLSLTLGRLGLGVSF